ncbi:hypothetical protein DER46DRAFT_587936 [Fusarium sp. MPI-SDFR-AT-0072]|nr:hypothetical protein DER46DRAFT_587936 [Fusarium sp. MPI-SDFR-AT-0072]
MPTIEDKPIALNSTQSVVVALANTLPKATYHVFVDNLLSSSDQSPDSCSSRSELNRANKSTTMEFSNIDPTGRVFTEDLNREPVDELTDHYS